MLILLSVEGVAQAPVYRNYTVRDGLAHDITYEIIQDRYGYIWLGTDDGLSKFNGKQFRNYSYQNGLKSNYVIDLSFGNNQELYIGTWGGGVHVMQDDTIVQLATSNNITGKISRIYHLHNSVKYGKKNLNVYRIEKGVDVLEDYKVIIDNENLRHIPLEQVPLNGASTSTNEILIDSTLFIYGTSVQQLGKGTVDGVYSYDGYTFERLEFKGLQDVCVTALWKEGETFWLASGQQLFKYRNGIRISEFDVGIDGESIIQLHVRNKMAYFVALSLLDGSRKFYSFDLINRIFVDITQQLEIKSFVSDFLFDKDGGLWITTYGQGLYYLPDTPNLFFDERIFENPDLREIDTLDGQLVLLSPNNLFFFNQGEVERQVKIPYHSETFQINRSTNRVELISLYRPQASSDILENGIGIVFNKKFHFKSGEIDVQLTKNEVAIYKNHLLMKEWLLDVQSVLKNAVRVGDKIYCIYDREGVLVLDAFTGMLLDTWKKDTGYFTDNFTDILPDPDRDGFWCATDVGLLFVGEGSKQMYTVGNGLISNHVNSVCIDQHNVIWVATQKGLMVYVNDKFYLIDQQLGQKSSFVTKVVEYGDWIYAIGNSGLFKFNNIQRFQSRQNTQLFIRQVDSEFSLDCINYLNASSIKVDYRLNNQKWVRTRDEIVNFSNLKNGEYKIQFRYKDDLSDWRYSNKYFFELVSPWYRTLWFYTLSILTVSSLVVVLVYMQLRRSIQKNKFIVLSMGQREKLQEDLNNVRHQIAQDFHDDLGNKLASISIISDMSLRKMDEDNPFYRDLSQIRKDSNELFNGMRDFVWSLDASHNQLFEVQLYLNDFGEQLFENSAVNFKSYNNVSQLDYTLPHYWNKQLVLIFKEAMTNVLKHSQATEVVFEVIHKNRELTVSLVDNGIGFEREKLRRVNGLNNMIERIKSIGGELIIETNQKGTKIIFKSKPLTI